MKRAAALLLALLALPAVAGVRILFIGNSFTYGADSDVQAFGAGSVTDLNGQGIGGVPALFKAFTLQAGLDYDVSLETQPASNLDFHLRHRRALVDQRWDQVVMHGQSTLDFDRPGNSTRIAAYTGLLARMFRERNPQVQVRLTATWARADLLYRNPASPWYGRPAAAMACDVQAGYEHAAARHPGLVAQVIPVGLAWLRAMHDGIADPNPYDGLAPGQLDLWAADHYHASNAGYYLHALMAFGSVTGVDPRTLGGAEQAAARLGLTPAQASALQQVARAQLQADPRRQCAPGVSQAGRCTAGKATNGQESPRRSMVGACRNNK